jgi:hypothetical protein
MAKSCKIPSSRGTLTNAQWINAQREAIRICERRKIPMHLVCSSCKKPQVVECRDEIIRVLDGWGWSTPQIGGVLSKNHSSIVIARQRMGARGIRFRARVGGPDGVHLGSDRTNGPREVTKGVASDDNPRTGSGRERERCTVEVGGSDRSGPAERGAV